MRNDEPRDSGTKLFLFFLFFPRARVPNWQPRDAMAYQTNVAVSSFRALGAGEGLIKQRKAQRKEG